MIKAISSKQKIEIATAFLVFTFAMALRDIIFRHIMLQDVSLSNACFWIGCFGLLTSFAFFIGSESIKLRKPKIQLYRLVINAFSGSLMIYMFSLINPSTIDILTKSSLPLAIIIGSFAGHRYTKTENFIEKGHLVPARITHKTESKIFEYIPKVLTALGIKNGPSHTEIIINQQSISVVECHNRCGGDGIVRLIEIASAIPYRDLMVDQALGESIIHRIPEHISFSNYAVSWFKTETPIGNVISIEGIDYIEEMTNIDEFNISVIPGESIRPIRQSRDRPAGIITFDIAPEAALNRAQEAINQLVFITSE